MNDQDPSGKHGHSTLYIIVAILAAIVLAIVCPAVLGGTEGKGHSVVGVAHPGPVDAAEHRSRFRRQARACLSGQSPRDQARRKRREAQGSRSAAQTKPWGALTFGYFSLGKQRKVTRPAGRNKMLNYT